MKRRKVKNVALYVDARRPEAAEAAKVVARLAIEAGAELQMKSDQSQAAGLGDVRSPSSFPAGADVLISLGGDGTLLQGAHLAAPLGVPVVGVDFGRMGFLTEVNRSDYQAVLTTLLTDGFETESRIALEATAAGKSPRYFAVNDIHIDRRHQGHIVGFGIEISGQSVAHIPADGIVVSSPTGSTAYFLSAGGPILAPGLEAFGIAPICPHTLFSRPLVVGATEAVRITIPGDSTGAQLYADGRLETELPAGSYVDIVRAACNIDFVRVGERYFFEVLEQKLHWGTSIKRPALQRDAADTLASDEATNS
ncbi:MAG: NAD(+)/NADH kinase [Candidatus Eremiobacteraeota bacterium]|nr:NAD(+)/NADH kinase [Candidatus Eremiobacteraeota bacterium]MBC5827215.1 NAD(+)/NADH kinase [Candidatus Eremiobacteraeota bacterium]